MRKVLFLSSTRADFGKLKSLIRALDQAPGFETQIFATGMHMLSCYGSTYDEIYKEGFKKVFLCFNQTPTIGQNMDLVVANTISGLSYYVQENNPDLLVVHGDRAEPLAGAIVGALNNLRVAHIEGGEISGTVDEIIRHAITKLAHTHFVANDEARQRLIQMGEEPSRIHVIGSPDIDIMMSERLPSLEKALTRYEIPFSDYAVFCYHPVTTERSRIRKNISQVLEAVMGSGLNYVVILPNNDPGSEIIRDALTVLDNNPRFRTFPSIRFEYFVVLLKHAKAIVGNSSAGIREAPIYGVPTVNIGSRQQNRFCHESIVSVPEEKAAIAAVLADLPPGRARSNHFGNGDSAQRFLNVLQDPAFWEHPIQKQFCDLSLRPA